MAPTKVACITILFASLLPPVLRADVEIYSIAGDSEKDHAGWSVAGVGDLDGDGFADFAVGSPGATGRGIGGIVKVYSGRDASVFAVLSGLKGWQLGRDVAGTGDLNGDGFADLVVGARAYASFTGRVKVYSGAWIVQRSGASVLHDFIGGAVGDQFGFSVAAGRVGADSVNDLVIGAIGARKVYVYDGVTGQLLYVKGDSGVAGFGERVCVVGDLDQDGREEFAVGVSSDDPSGTDSGSVSVYSGGNGSLMIQLAGEAKNSYFGFSVESAGDVNHDGIPDLIVGAPGEPKTTATVFSGLHLAAGTEHVLHQWHGPDYSSFGIAVDGAFDFDADGTPDLIVGTSSLGNVSVFSGADGRLLEDYEPGLKTFGWAVAAAGDVDADGDDDLIVGAPFDSPTGGNSGSAHVLGGTPCPADWWVARGGGWAGKYGVPELYPLGEPELGKTVLIHIENSAGADMPLPGFLFVGLATANLPTSWGGTLNVVPMLTLPFVIPPVALDLPAAIPDDESLCGVMVHLQVLEADSFASHGVSFTRLLTLLIGE